MEITAAAHSSTIALRASCNLRDVGELRGWQGRRVPRGRLYRGDSPHHVDPADVAVVHALGLRTIIDLRTHDEVATRPGWLAHSTAVALHLPMFDVVPDPEELQAWVDPAHVARRYREMLDDADEVIADVLATLTDPATYPVLVHCTAGKDRTGIVTAIVLGALGVGDDHIASDYAASGPGMARKVDMLIAEHPDARDRIERVAAAMITANPYTMRDFLAGIRRDHGSVAGYLASLGMGSAVGYLRDALLEP
jgi:protein-tyrosine phosphatase